MLAKHAIIACKEKSAKQQPAEKDMKNVIIVLTITLLLQTTVSWAAPVVRDNRMWLQPADLVNVSYDDAIAVCPAPDFVCKGSLNGINVTGFTFASYRDTYDLLNGYGIDPPITEFLFNQEITKSQLTEILADFQPTYTGDDQGEILGLVRETFDDGILFAASTLVVWVNLNGPNEFYSEVNTFNGYNLPGFSPFLGVWLYRDIKPVPTLSTYGLLMAMLGLFGIAGYRLSRKHPRQG